jgi:hypothetical protein
MPIVADSSGIIHLAAIGRLDLLRQMYGSVVLPPSVWDEVVVQGRGRPGEQELRKAAMAGWTTVVSPVSGVAFPTPSPSLHPGETEAIRLAVEIPGSLLLMDEAAGRYVAASLGVRVIGIVGILVRAKQVGLLAELKPVLEELQNPGGFRLTKSLVEHALGLVGERP